MNVQKLSEQAEFTRRLIAGTKPRSRRRIELEMHLRDLVTKQLRAETRQSRRTA